MTPEEREQQIREARKASEDYRAELDKAMDAGDAEAIARNLYGWSLTSTVAGLGVLSRPGIDLTDEQQAYVKDAIERGKTADAQRVILDSLSEQAKDS